MFNVTKVGCCSHSLLVLCLCLTNSRDVWSSQLLKTEMEVGDCYCDKKKSNVCMNLARICTSRLFIHPVFTTYSFQHASQPRNPIPTHRPQSKGNYGYLKQMKLFKYFCLEFFNFLNAHTKVLGQRNV